MAHPSTGQQNDRMRTLNYNKYEGATTLIHSFNICKKCDYCLRVSNSNFEFSFIKRQNGRI